MLAARVSGILHVVALLQSPGREAEGTHALCDAVVNNIRKAQKQTAQVKQRSLSDVHKMALMHSV
jgi:hypothetical protein